MKLGLSLALGIAVLLLVSAAPITTHRAGPQSAPISPAPGEACGAAISCPIVPHPAAVVHDLGVTSLQVRVLAGAPFAVTAVAPAGAALTTISWWFGDGTSLLGQSALSTNHTYLSPGLDYIYASADDAGGTTHDNLDRVLPVEVLSSHAGDAWATVPDLIGSVVANTSGGANPTALIAPGESVSVAVTAVTPPRNVQTVVVGSGFSGPVPTTTHASLSGEYLAPNGTSGVTLAFDAGQPSGLLTLTYWEETSLVFNGSTILTWNNYTFGVGVGLGGGSVPLPRSPTPNQLTVETGGTPYTFDPAVGYDSAGREAFLNVYQTLITTNGTRTGSDPGDFVPEIATCVPGSALCTALYGSSLVTGAENFTFVISNASQFYDPATASSWGVYPTDVLFSIARTLAFSTIPCPGCNNGWILAQALLDPGNATGGQSHRWFNNTPGPVLSSMTVNGTDCPASAIANEHGCVTFHASANGKIWPYFLSLIANPWGGSIVSCGWFSAPAQGAGIPYWSEGNVTGSGDGPCAMPGVGGFGIPIASIPALGWEYYEVWGSQPPFIGNVQYAMAGSGPYAATTIAPGSSYTLTANPSYAANPYCTFSGCQPAPGSYPSTVQVVYTPVPSDGPLAIANGAADFAEFPQNGSSTLPALIGSGAAGLTTTPILQIQFHAFNLYYDHSLAQSLTGINYTAPASFLADENLRQFLLHAFAYSDAQTKEFTQQGLQYRFPSGGAIPAFVDQMTPTNVSWPSGNPDPVVADVGSAAWWWDRTANDLYSGLTCTAASPCSFPVPFVLTDTTEFHVLQSWSATVRAISGGAVVPMITPVDFVTLVIDALYLGAYGNPFPIYPLGWFNDFADPASFTAPLYLPDNTFTLGDAVQEILTTPTFNSSSCPSTLTYYSSLAGPIPVDCQGAAYLAMVQALGTAADVPNGPARTLWYNEVEQVAQRLGLYAGNGQSNLVTGFAAWIDPQSVVINPSLDAIPWYEVRALPGSGAALAIRGPLVDVNPTPAMQPIHFSGLATGGASGYHYSWTGLPAGCTPVASPTLACTPSLAGSYTISLHVTDQLGATALGSAALVVTAPLPLSFTSFSAVPSSVPAGNPTVLTVRTTGGVAPLAYGYTGLPPGCATVDLPSFSCTPTAQGSYSIFVTVTDAGFVAVGGSGSLEVTAPTNFLVALTVAPVSAVVDVGVVLNLTVQGFGGTLPIHGTIDAPGNCARTFTWTTVRTTAFACTAPTTAGSYNLTVNLTDATTLATQSSTLLVVNAAPSILSLGPRTTFDVGQIASLTLAYAGGTGPYTIAYSGLPPGCAADTPTSLACRFNQSGSFATSITITDSYGLVATSTAHFTVAPTLVLASFAAEPASIPLGGFTNLTVTIVGGSTPLTYVFASLPPGCPGANRSLLLCLPTEAGTFAIAVAVHDLAGFSVFANASLIVTGTGGGGPGSLGGVGDALVPWVLLAGAAVLVAGAILSYSAARRPRAPSEEGPTGPAEVLPEEPAPELGPPPADPPDTATPPE